MTTSVLVESARLDGLTMAYKLLRRSCFTDKEFVNRLGDLRDEMKIYNKRLAMYQGDIIPHFLFAGPIVDPSYWIMPEEGEIFGFVTTYEGRSLVAYAESNCPLPWSVREKALADLKKIHKQKAVHGDIKLQNLVYNEEKKQIIFIDFGNAMCESDYKDECFSFEGACKDELGDLGWVLGRLTFDEGRELSNKEQHNQQAPESSL